MMVSKRLRLGAAAVLVLFMFTVTLQFNIMTDTPTRDLKAAGNLRAPAVTTAPTTNPPPTETQPEPSPTRKRFSEPTVSVQPGTRGILLCLHDRILQLGLSLITELRCLGNHERIYVYHCLGELTQANQELIHTVETNIEIIDVCDELLSRNVTDRAILQSFRSFWLKPLALHQTKVDHVLMLDADALLLQDPATLRTNERYVKNGTIFFHDRVVKDNMYFNRQIPVGNETEQYLRQFLQTFDYDRLSIPGGYVPSHHLLHSFAYTGRSAHEMDSSMVLIRKSAPQAAVAMSVLWVLITETRYDFEFSYGDKESFWLAYELAHAPYAFSPWGASVLSSTTNRDMEIHASTLCGSLAHYVPNDDPNQAPELLYVNGKALVDPVPFDTNDLKHLRANLLFNLLPTHMSPRRPRTAPLEEKNDARGLYSECLAGLGATPTPPQLLDALWRRRMHFMAISMNRMAPLQICT